MFCATTFQRSFIFLIFINMHIFSMKASERESIQPNLHGISPELGTLFYVATEYEKAMFRSGLDYTTWKGHLIKALSDYERIPGSLRVKPKLPLEDDPYEKSRLILIQVKLFLPETKLEFGIRKKTGVSMSDAGLKWMKCWQPS